MHIALDATAVRSLNHGIGTYVANLLLNLVKVEPDNHYISYMTKQAIENLQPLNLPAERVTFRPVTGIRPLRIIWEQFLLSNTTDRECIDLLWGCHNTLPSFKKCPQVVTIHDIGMLRVPRFYPRAKVDYFRWAITHAVQRADIVVTVSTFTKSELIDVLRLPESKVKVVMNGVRSHYRLISNPADAFRVRQRYNLPPKFIFSLGVPEPKKNLERVIGAYADLKKRRPDIPRLVIGGGKNFGWKNRRIYQLAHTLGDTIILTDFISHEDLPVVYNLAEMFVFPSLYEGFGLPPLEAMACGVPVISSNVASLPEVLDDAALLVDPTRQEEIMDAMEQILINPGLSHRLKARGLVNAERFSWRKTAQTMIAIFRDAAGKA
ncbi:hypothetical protein CH330_08710 [candidate division WOR-3 bacterium JGI_Cruoil_03_51_56]|uniref:Glycosyl transferase family 1 n=1 Tax=candidate division WOR-3 bacterium JGI_Cruoil_03_51_56 TaxID=1973747 RepID=A0A235BS94_UNCW3|nr:MAG: hypothetical protein CH330_08710 [candidate division WOR-3 bacterium JGI_Cruoil_03_51_56]